MTTYYYDLLSNHLGRINDEVQQCTLLDEANNAVFDYCVVWGLEPHDFIIKMNREQTTFEAAVH